MHSPTDDPVPQGKSSEPSAPAGTADQLLPLVYDELRALARRAMQRESADHTLQTTAVVHEAYLRLRDQRQLTGMSRAHFLSVAATMIRRILVDHARARAADKRGGDAQRETLSRIDIAQSGGDGADAADVLALDAALTRLAALSERAARVVELRYFAGMSIADTAQTMDVSERLVNSEWSFARAWLRRELGGGK